MNGELGVMMAWLFLIVVCGIAIYCNWNPYWQRLKQAWVRFKKRVKTACDSSERCKDMRAYAKKNPAISLSYLLFVILTIVFGIFFPWFFYSFITSLYTAVDQKIKDGIDVNSYGFRSISLSIAGSITLLITILGVLLTLIRNLLTRQQNRTDEERLVTEQISRAVEQIGAYKQGVDEKSYEPNIEVRLGGLYSLQRIMKDSPRDEITIARNFSAYVRENVNKNKVKKKNVQPREDVQTALEIINQFNKVRREHERREIHTDLSRVDFNGYSIAHIDFSGFILRDIVFSDEKLFNTNFSKAYLRNADFSKTKNLMEVDFSNATLYNANLSGAILFKINVSGATLYHANLSKATLHDVDLSNRRLFKVDLSGATLLNVNLSEANLQDTNLESAILSTVKNLTQEQVDKAKGNEKTKLPDGLNRPKHWIKKKKPATKKTKKE